MTCKDCIHYEACNANENFLTFPYENVEYFCPVSFKEKSQFIELPCKVGDTVYTIPRSKIRKWEVVYIGLCGDGSVHFNIKYYKKKSDFATIQVTLNQFNKYWFADRQIAEAKLKELNNECNK